VSSTLGSRLVTQILEKTGFVERSGQGTNKIFFKTQFEGKVKPDYKNRDQFQVSLTLRTEIIDKAVRFFIGQNGKSKKTSRSKKITIFPA
jgi:ATP-dependent DNA helicase RecG